VSIASVSFFLGTNTDIFQELGYGKEYKYNPEYLEGRVVQEYLPEKIKGRSFLEDSHLGTKMDPELENVDSKLDAA
jgi:putative ATPase